MGQRSALQTTATFLFAKKTDHIGKSQVSVLANLNCVGDFRNQEVALQSMMTSHCGVGRLAANQGLMSQSRTKYLAKAPKYSEKTPHFLVYRD